MFVKYDEIENTYRKKTIEELKSKSEPTDIFVVTEKIHGMNFSFIIDSKNEIQMATRNNVITVNENSIENKLLQQYKNNLLKLVQLIKNRYPQIITVQIYGELFGGKYNNKSEGRRIQKGVEYIPFNDIMFFDIRVETLNGSYFLPFVEVEELINKSDLKLVPIIYKGNLENCLNYDTNFLTTIPKLYNLPDIEGNICEGVVIRPYNNDILNVYGRRILLKNKNDKFAEKQRAPKRKRKNNVELSEDNQELINDILEYATENRLNNVISKGIDVDFKNFSIISKAFIDDIFKDFQKDYDLPESLEILLKQEPSILKIVKNEINAIVRNYIKNDLGVLK